MIANNYIIKNYIIIIYMNHLIKHLVNSTNRNMISIPNNNVSKRICFIHNNDNNNITNQLIKDFFSKNGKNSSQCVYNQTCKPSKNRLVYSKDAMGIPFGKLTVKKRKHKLRKEGRAGTLKIDKKKKHRSRKIKKASKKVKKASKKVKKAKKMIKQIKQKENTDEVNKAKLLLKEAKKKLRKAKTKAKTIKKKKK